MLKINKTQEPDFFRSFIKKNNPENWANIVNKTSQELRKHISENEQKANNQCLCVYCERKITEIKSHIEHIKPQSKFPSEIFNYSNLVVSCDDKDTCGKHKGGKWDDKFINPVIENPEYFFEYITNGEIIASNLNKERSFFTIEILNMNYDKLKSCRKIIFLRLEGYPKEYIKSIDQYFDEFPSLINYYKNHYNNNYRVERS